MSQPRIDSGAKAEVVMDDADNGDSVSSNPSVGIRVTAQWSVNDPVIYVNHATGSDFVDLAIGGSGDNDVIARFQIRDPLDVLRAGHNLIRAGLSLAETRGVDIDQLKVLNPSVWWSQIPFTTTDESVPDEESPGP
jgi:hypothetical protein